MEQNTTGELLSVLKSAKPEDADTFLTHNSDALVQGENPFADYMRAKFKSKGIRQQQVFLNANIPERYGYKLITGEKHTKQRDYILRICCVAQFTLKETQHALALYGMPGLYARTPRDAVLIIAFNTGCDNVYRLDEMLLAHDMQPLKSCGEEEPGAE